MSRRSSTSIGLPLPLVAALALVACGDDGASPADATPDAAATDRGPGLDAEVSDGGGELDGGAPDAGLESDAGVPDAGELPLGPVTVDLELAQPPALLSDFNFFRYRGNGVFEYNDGVVPYDLNTPLFSDFALKARALYVPPGTSITYTATTAFDFPVGSAIIKSFLVAADLRVPDENVRIVETRVMIRYPDGWQTWPYLWRVDDSDADRFVRGQVEEVSFIDPLGQPRTAQYLVPQKNQCVKCHELQDESGDSYTTIIGPKARHLNRSYSYDGQTKNQLEHLSELGLLSGLPDLAQVEKAFDYWALYSTSTSTLDYETLNRAARDYLDVNCAHCHNPNAVQGITSRLFLNYDNEDAFNLGVCKEPGSAGSGTGGRRWDIVPGSPDDSILVYRTETEQVGDMMPLLGRSVADDVGVALLRAWIEQMPGTPCE